ncbi:hypothetical protein EJ04DRAFT_576509 [Polyplosphaeria fusca]|uniref:Uncharacterized protein n=1 Tax=Polyplosphaeria fusca TaxID=682080 RepID=A0A9P4R1F2_9PLEO|nr:hypothetical protein EJ04DRAFT_576509 [Polyplosphaeria fusca]
MSELLDFLLTYEEAFKSQGRLASLYSDFRNQLSLNPDGYHANVNAWKKALADAARAGVIPSQGPSHDLLSIQAGHGLVQALQHKQHGLPTCLPVVFADAEAKKEMVPLKDFLASDTTIYQTSWMPSPWEILQWGLRLAGVLEQPGFGDKLKTENLVVVGNLEIAANQVLKQMADPTSSIDLVLSHADLHRRFAHVLDSSAPLTSNDLKILLRFLQRDKQALSYNDKAIKFKSSNDPAPAPITQEDEAIATLRDTLARVESQIPPLAEKIASADASAKEFVRTKQLTRAKATLRQKKMAEAALAERTDIALQLEGVYAQLQQAADQVEVVAAMKASAVALRGLNERVGGAEGVADVMDDLREQHATADDINRIINESSEQIDEGEVEDEFEALEKAEREKQETEAKARREKEEQEEAANIAARFAELEKGEKSRREKEEQAAKEKAEKEAQEKKERTGEESNEKTEEEILKTSQELAQLSFQEDEAQEEESRKEDENTPLPA